MDDKQVTISDVRTAFERLLEKIDKSGCDPEYGQTVYFAQVDVLDILAGKWDGEAETEEPEAADVERCPACNQSLRDIEQSYFACPTCYETFGDEATKAAALPF